MKSINLWKRKRNRLFAFAILVVVVLAPAVQAYTAINYPNRNSPYYSGDYAPEITNSVEALTVVSYNIGFAENIDQAILDLRQIQSQKELDIVLLQEMDEVGIERIAQELQMNYAYFPAAIEPTYDKNFGNAILSRWPITDPQKLILPHKSLSNHMNRIATKSTIRIPGADLLVYSIHTESVFTLPQFRKDQNKTVIGNIDPAAKLVIVGGDFNSYTAAAVAELEEEYQQAGFLRASEGGDPTVVKFGIEMSTDHIFTKGFVVEDAETLTTATASDHFPIWVTLTPK